MADAKTYRCANCMQVFTRRHRQNGCVLAAFADVIRDRGNKSEAEIRKLLENCSVDTMWDQLGPVIDDLEAGVFNESEAEHG